MAPFDSKNPIVAVASVQGWMVRSHAREEPGYQDEFVVGFAIGGSGFGWALAMNRYGEVGPIDENYVYEIFEESEREEMETRWVEDHAEWSGEWEEKRVQELKEFRARRAAREGHPAPSAL